MSKIARNEMQDGVNGTGLNGMERSIKTNQETKERKNAMC